MKNKALALIIGFIHCYSGFSQTIELPLLYDLKKDYYQQAVLNDDTIHLGYSSLYSNQLSSVSEFPFVIADTISDRTWAHRKLFNENFLILNTKNLYLTLDPIFNFAVGSDLSDSSGTTLYTNTRGIRIAGQLGKNIIFSTSFLENQARFPSYINTFISNNGVVPEMGRVKSFKDGGYDYAMATAAITWDATPFLRIKLGNDKDFLGFGYRSVLLSDNAFNYTHLKLDFWFAKHKLKYTLNYALLQDLVRMPDGETPESLFERKLGAFHYLSYTPNSSFSIGLYSGTILPQINQDSVKNYYLDAFNPLFMVNPFLNNPYYVNKIGLNLSYVFLGRARVYFEFAENPADWDQYSTLIGFSTWNLFTKNLDLCIEYSMVRASEDPSNTNLTDYYSHYSQSLGHTLGSGFQEIYFRLSYEYKRMLLLVAMNFADRRVADAQVWGFVNESEPLPSNTPSMANSFILNSELAYLFNPKTNMNIALGYRMKRSGANEIFGETDYLYLAFRTTLFNQYVDF